MRESKEEKIVTVVAKFLDGEIALISVTPFKIHKVGEEKKIRYLADRLDFALPEEVEK